MSVRDDEEQRKKNCTGRGLGLAAAAIGVGVGAALYYFISKRPEQSTGEGSSNDGWRERPQAFENDDESFTTKSELITSDSSMEEEYICCCHGCKINRSETVSTIHGDTSEGSEFTQNTSVLTDDSTQNTPTNTSYASTPDTSINTGTSTSNLDTSSPSYESISISDILESNSEDSNNMENFTNNSSIDAQSTHPWHVSIVSSDSYLRDLADDNADMDVIDGDSSGTSPNPTRQPYSATHSTPIRFAQYPLIVDDWEVTETSLGVPEDDRQSLSPLRRMINRLAGFEHSIDATPSPVDKARAKAFRERRWSLEECSICFDVMLTDQELMSLPCTHNFHVACIGPWLQQQQSCPMCRKAIQ